MKAARVQSSVLSLALGLLLLGGPARAQFRDDFDSVRTDPEGLKGWRYFTGDGTATMDFRQGGPGYASIFVDATTDKRGIWWALVERAVSSSMDLSLLRKPGHEVRIEARIRTSHAPRRVNLQVLTQRTTDYHSHLMEFDIPDTDTWHTISMTTHGFDAGPGDTLIGHLALMDWGLAKYRVDLDYVKLDVVDVASAPPDVGAAVPYHPPVADPESFAHDVRVAQDSTIDLQSTDVNLNDWREREGTRKLRLLAVDGTHDAILRFDLSAFAGRKVEGGGLLALVTRSVERKDEEVKDFGIVRVVEMMGGDPGWEEANVTTDSLCHYQPLDRVLNPQPIIDWPVTEGDGGTTYFTISRPVLQRLVDGETTGIAVKALGAVNVAFYAREDEGGTRAARLLFNLESLPGDRSSPGARPAGAAGPQRGGPRRRRRGAPVP
jgi:hypothetical protein